MGSHFPDQGWNPGPPALAAWSLSPWTTREVPNQQILIVSHVPGTVLLTGNSRTQNSAPSKVPCQWWTDNKIRNWINDILDGGKGCRDKLGRGRGSDGARLAMCDVASLRR